jgi:hypothetical protein
MRSRAIFTLGFALLILVGMAPVPAAAGEQAGSAQMPTSIAISTIGQSAGPRLVSFGDVAVQDTACADTRACIWDRADYGGSKLVFFGSDEGLWQTNFTVRSAKNHFDNRAVGFYNINTGDRVRCANPNTNHPGPFPDATRLVLIGALGTRC